MKSDEFKTYSWETDEGWIKVEKRLDFPAGLSTWRKRKAIEKKKLRYYKRNVNPDYDPVAAPAESAKADPTKTEKKSEPTKISPDEKTEPKETFPKISQKIRGEKSSGKKETPEEPEKSSEKKETPNIRPTDSNPRENEIANGTFVKLELKNAKYNGLVGEIADFLPDLNRYLVRLHLPETARGVYKGEIKVPVSSLSSTSKMPVYGEMLLHCLVLVFSVISFFSKQYYSYSLYSSILVNLFGLVYLKGKPKMNAVYAQDAISSPQALNLLCSLALLMAKPYIFFLAPPLCRSVNRGFGMLSSLMEKDSPSLYAMLKPIIDPILARRANFQELSTTMEVYLGFGQVIGIIFGMSSFGSIFIYWNFLRMKYMFSFELKKVFAQVKLSVDQKLYSYPRVKGYWQKACNFAHSYVDENQLQRQYAQSSSGGMMSKLKNMCNIM